MKTARFLLGLSVCVFVGCNTSTTEPTAEAQSFSVEPAVQAADLEAGAGEQEEASKLNATEVLAAAISQAKQEDKRVFVHLGAPW